MKTILFYIAVVILGVAVNVAANAKSYVVEHDGEVNAYSLGGIADYESLMNAKFSDGSLDDPYISNRSAMFQEFTHGIHEAGSEVTFVLRVLDTGKWFYSNDKFNRDGHTHHVFTKEVTLADGRHGLMVGFEDIKFGGDRDFNDNIAIFTNVIQSPIPEPSTYLMLLVGLILLGFTTTRKRKTCGFLAK